MEDPKDGADNHRLARGAALIFGGRDLKCETAQEAEYHS